VHAVPPHLAHLAHLVRRTHPAAWAHLAALLLAVALGWAPAMGRAQQPATGTVLPPALLARAAALISGAASVLAPEGARIQSQPGSLDSRLTLAPCADIEAHLLPGLTPWGRTRVGLRCRDGSARWAVTLPVTVQVFAPALVAAAALPAGATLGADQLLLAEVDWAAHPVGTLHVQAQAPALQGRSLARPLGAGQPLMASDLRQRQWFAAGDTVQVRALGTGFVISTEAVALTPGIEGRPARLRTAAGKLLQAQPVGERHAEMPL
jgi:flagella basal body P-ring formation protein FlgA